MVALYFLILYKSACEARLPIQIEDYGTVASTANTNFSSFLCVDGQTVNYTVQLYCIHAGVAGQPFPSISHYPTHNFDLILLCITYLSEVFKRNKKPLHSQWQAIINLYFLETTFKTLKLKKKQKFMCILNGDMHS